MSGESYLPSSLATGDSLEFKIPPRQEERKEGKEPSPRGPFFWHRLAGGVPPVVPTISPELEAFNAGRLEKFKAEVEAKDWDAADKALTELLKELSRRLLTPVQVEILSGLVHPLLAERLPDGLDFLLFPEGERPSLAAKRERVLATYQTLFSESCHWDKPVQASFYLAAAQVLLKKGYALPNDNGQNASCYWQAFQAVSRSLVCVPSDFDLMCLGMVGTLEAQLSLLVTPGKKPCDVYLAFLRQIEALRRSKQRVYRQRAERFQQLFFSDYFEDFLTSIPEGWSVDPLLSGREEKAWVSELEHRLEAVLASSALLGHWGKRVECQRTLELAREAFASALDGVRTHAQRFSSPAGSAPDVGRERGAFFYASCRSALTHAVSRCSGALLDLEGGGVFRRSVIRLDSGRHRMKVQIWLSHVEQGLQEDTPIRTLLQQSTKEVQALLIEMFQTIERVLGSAPCAFAVLGLDAYARDACLPCSDLTLAILVEEAAQRPSPYFVALMRLLQLNCACLPTDVLPLAMDSVDGLLCGEKPLLHTPQGMVDAYLPLTHADGHGPLKACYPRLIWCSRTRAAQAAQLLPQYQAALATRFRQRVEGRLLHEAVGGLCLASSVVGERVVAEHKATEMAPPMVSITESYLRPVETASLAWGVYYQIKERKAEFPETGLVLCPYAILDRLAEQKILHPAFIQDTQALLDRSHRARLKLHLAWLGKPRPPEAEKDRLFSTAPAGDFSVDFSVDEKALGLEAGQWQVMDPLKAALGLWQGHPPRAEAGWDPLEAHYQGVYQAVRAHPLSVSDAQLAVLARYPAHREQFDLAWHRQQFLELPQDLRDRYEEQLSRFFPRAQRPLLQRLRLLPDPAGWRLKTQHQGLVWEENLAQLWEPEAKEGVRVQLIERGRIVTRYLRPALAAQVLSVGRFKPKDRRQAGNHRVYPITLGRDVVFWFKLFPEQPATEGIIHDLDAMLGCFGTPAGQLLKLYAKDERGQERGYAVYVSQAISGESLETVLKRHPEDLEKLSPAAWVSTLLRVLLTNPEDDKGDDYFLVRLPDGRYGLQRIDNERAFFQPFAVEKLQVKSVLYCFDAMAQPLASTPEGQAVLADFLSLEPISVMAQLLSHLKEAQALWQGLFTAEEILVHFRQPSPEMSLPLLMWADGLEKELLNRLTALQTVLRLNPQATGLDLLTCTQPKLGAYYRRVHARFPSENKPHRQVLRRFDTATGDLYRREGDRLTSTMAGPLAVSQSLRLPSALDEKTVLAIYRGERLSPTQALVGFTAWQAQRGAQILSGLTARGEEAKAQDARKQAKAQFQQLPLRHKTTLLEKHILPELKTMPPTNQVLILEAMAGTPWHYLPLSGFHAVLTDALLEPLLQGAGGHLVSLDLRDCSHEGFTAEIMGRLADHCPQLRQVYLRGQDQWRALVIGNFPDLIHLEIEGASRLEKLTLGDLPVLSHLSLSGAQQLSILGDVGWGLTASTQAWRLPQLTQLNTRGCRSLRTVHLAVDSLEDFEWNIEGCDSLKRPVFKVSEPSSFLFGFQQHLENLSLSTALESTYEDEEQKKKVEWQDLQDQLIVACEQGDLKGAREALRKGAKVGIAGSGGKRPLLAAVWGMNPEMEAFLTGEMKEAEREREKKRLPQEMQDRLVVACEQGDLEGVKKAVKLGAKVGLRDRVGKHPLGAAVWGMNPEVVNYLTEEMKGIAVLTWEECKSHNQQYYKEVFMFSEFNPQTYREWHQLLLKMNRSPFLAAQHLAEARKVWHDAFTSSWERFVVWVGRGDGALELERWKEGDIEVTLLMVRVCDYHSQLRLNVIKRVRGHGEEAIQRTLALGASR